MPNSAELLVRHGSSGDERSTARRRPKPDHDLRTEAGRHLHLLLLAARDYIGWAVRVPWLAAVFFVGGAGRAFSWLVVGAPHPFFLLLMTIELALPPLLVLLWWRAGGPSASKA